jgi:hypothetical protein
LLTKANGSLLFANGWNFKKTKAMKKIYTIVFAFTTLLVFNGCSKDILKSYEDRIVGTWELDDVDRVGFGGDNDNLPFHNGTFVFSQGGGLTYTNRAGEVYSGSWDIQRINTSDEVIRSLHVSVVNFTTQDIRSELFEEIRFTGTNKFKCFIRQGLHSWVFKFER